MKLKTVWQGLMIGVLAFLAAGWIAGFFGELGYGVRRGLKTYQISLVAGSFGGIKGRNSLLAGVYWVPLKDATPFDAELPLISHHQRLGVQSADYHLDHCPTAAGLRQLLRLAVSPVALFLVHGDGGGAVGVVFEINVIRRFRKHAMTDERI